MKANCVGKVTKIHPNSQEATYAIKGIQMMSAGETVLREVGSGNSASLKHWKAQRIIKNFALIEEACHC